MKENNLLKMRFLIFKESKEANKLIEEFMLIANKKVASSTGSR